jgi:hypothetical protein
MAENERNTGASLQSQVEAAYRKNIAIIHKNPSLSLQFQNQAGVLYQLQNQMKKLGPKYSYQKSPQSNFQVNQVVNTSSKLNLHQMGNKAKKYSALIVNWVEKSPVVNWFDEYSSLFDISANAAEFIQKRIINPKDTLIQLGGLAREFGSSKVPKEINKLITKMPNFLTRKVKILAQKLVHSNLGQKVVGLNIKPINVLMEKAKQIAQIPALGEQKLGDELSRIGKIIKRLGYSSLVEKLATVPKASKILKLEKVLAVIKLVKGLGLVSTAFDVKSVTELISKLARTGKLSRGDWADFGISGVSLAGTGLGIIAGILGLAGATALATSLIPLAGVIGIAAATASVVKFIYDKQSDQRKNQIKALVKQIGKGYLSTQPLLYRNIPMNAHGTSYFSGGLSLVGEEGPELVNLPRGSQVFSYSRTQSLLKGMGSGSAGISVNYSPQITIQGNADTKVMKTASDNSYADFERKFNALMDRRRRLSFAGG